MKLLLILLIGLEILDGIFTHQAITIGLVQELNPVMTGIAGDWRFLLLKVVGAIGCAAVLWVIYGCFPRIAMMCASSVVIFYGLVFTWNFGTIFSL